jgi:hypothetical protein
VVHRASLDDRGKRKISFPYWAIPAPIIMIIIIIIIMANNF